MELIVESDRDSVQIRELKYPLEQAAHADLARFVDEAYAPTFGSYLNDKFPEYWRWLYKFGSRSIVAMDGNRIIGHVGCVPFVAVAGGTRVPGTWSVDTFVLPAYRRMGHGKRLQSVAQATSPLFTSVWMSAANGRIKLSMGQVVAAELVILRRLRSRVRGPDSRVGLPVPLEIATAAEPYLCQWDFCVERSSKYCAWRFIEQPRAGYKQVVCDEGLALTRRCGPKRSREGMIGDAFARGASKEAQWSLVEAASSYLFSDGCESVRFGTTDLKVVDYLLGKSWHLVDVMRLHVPRNTVSGSVFLSLSEQDIDQYPW